ncbi:hypothetical protein EKO04_007759 [Ascochyta lentis]|uniref:Heterokaryon incompatibility domain-containing protein n=1 Tax=Ascochyta lentis TaxID=205686 RepID=A0A8H7MGP2_9PLEO|nr:hypothetical protein EKO04_007759 [Ascochyta lentis]
MNTDRFLLYQALDPRRIRLLRIDPDVLATNTGTFEVFQLDTAPAFYALSHTWGTKKQDASICVDGVALSVSEHLAAGLRQLQLLAGDASRLNPLLQYIWIDNVCINQGDLDERSMQVRLMGNIYSRAVRTLIWLGDTSDGSPRAWQLVNKIYSVFERQHVSFSVPEEIPNQLFSDSIHSATGLPALESTEWHCLCELFEIQWFSRIWIVQEVVLSKRDPIFMHGNITFAWERVEWAASWLRRNGYLRLSQIPEGLLHVDNIGYLRRAKAEWPLNALMSITQNKFRATDQRDKVYGLLGMAAESVDSIALPDALIPDYSVEVYHVYLKAARFFLEHCGSLAILTRIRGTPGSVSRKRRKHDFENWPSWLPDWSDFAAHNRDIRKSFSWIHYGDISRPARLGFPKQYQASGDLPLKIHVTKNPAILSIEGLRVDTVARVLQMSNEDMLCDDFNHKFDSIMTQVFKLASESIEDIELENWAVPFIKATTADQQPLSGRTWNQGLKDGLAYLHRLLVESTKLAGVVSSERHTLTGSFDWLQKGAEGGDPTQYAALARNFCYARSFLVTVSGRIGIGPSDSLAGDSIAVVPGGGVPYLIRPNGYEWTFVGESYVHGIMHGEAVATVLSGNIAMKRLDFC